MDSTVAMIIGLSVFALLIAVIPLIVILRRRQSNTNRHKGPTVSSLPTKGSGELVGTPYHWLRSGAAQNKNPILKITLPGILEGHFTLRKENAFDRLAKKMGLSQEVTVYDKPFDDALYIVSSHSDFCQHLFGQSRIRSAATRLLERGFTQLKSTSKGLVLQWLQYRPKNNPVTPEEIPGLVEKLIEIAKGCQHAPLSEEDRIRHKAWKNKLTRLYLMTGIPLLLGLFALINGLVSYTPLDPGLLFLSTLKWSLPLFALTLFGLYGSLKGAASAHSHFIGLFFLSLAAVVLIAFGGMTFLNGSLDQSQAVQHSVLVVNRYTTQSKNDTNYHIETESWRTNGAVEDFRVSRSTYNRVDPGESRMRIVTFSGRYGFEWVHSKSIDLP